MMYHSIEDRYVKFVGIFVQTTGVQDVPDLFAMIASMITTDFACNAIFHQRTSGLNRATTRLS